VNAVTIGGDLWEDEHVSADTRRFVAAELGKLDCPALLICGNHDPYLPGGNYARTTWPDNVHIFDSPSPVEFPLGDPLSVWGVSWVGGDLTADFLGAGPHPDQSRTNLLLIHGTALGGFDNAHCPFNPAGARASGFSFCLAGHTHAASSSESLVYPGSPEPLGWGEMGRHCVALVEVGVGAPEVELLEVNSHSYEERRVDCRDCEHSAEVGERLASALADSDGEASSLHIRAVLEGEIGRDCWIVPEELRTAHGQRYAELAVEDRTHPSYDLEAIGNQPTAAGYFVRELRGQIDAEEEPDRRQVLELALDAGLRALEGHEGIVHVD
jgi:DNA repair protein SbcD/Mre11